MRPGELVSECGRFSGIGPPVGFLAALLYHFGAVIAIGAYPSGSSVHACQPPPEATFLLGAVVVEAQRLARESQGGVAAWRGWTGIGQPAGVAPVGRRHRDRDREAEHRAVIRAVQHVLDSDAERVHQEGVTGRPVGAQVAVEVFGYLVPRVLLGATERCAEHVGDVVVPLVPLVPLVIVAVLARPRSIKPSIQVPAQSVVVDSVARR